MIVKMKTMIGPHLHGHKMSLRAFEFAEVEPGYLYELSGGYIVVLDVPNFGHMRQVALIRRHVDYHYLENPGSIYEVLGTMECKLLIPDMESERHPDIAIYLHPPKNRKNRSMWRKWIPDLIMEIVSASSKDRDYTQKRDEYWTLGVKEYWIVDAQLEQVLILKRGRTQWIEKTLGRNDFCETKLLPGFKLACQAIFDAANEQGEE
jgi:Uma2 family endonuclease